MIPGVGLALGYLAWLLVVSFLAGIIDAQWKGDFAAGLMVVPFFVWLAASSHQLRSVGRRWWKSFLSPLFLVVWLTYALWVVPFLLGEEASVAGSESLGLIVNALLAGSMILVFDQLAVAIPRAEHARGLRGSGYLGTLLQFIFPPIALWVAHRRVVAAARVRGRRDV